MLGMPGWVLVIVFLASLAYGLLAELIRTRTLSEILSNAPAGTVVVLDGAPGGNRKMRVTVGSGLCVVREEADGGPAVDPL
jgi:hypothetical protein